MRAFVVAALASSILAACHGQEEAVPTPPPFRPPPATDVKPVDQSNDCKPTDPANEPAPLAFDRRSIPESQGLADEGAHLLHNYDSGEIGKLAREDAFMKAVSTYIKALDADPYNVGATYQLAGAYARINRPQCSINLLNRLLQMRAHPSKHAEVEKEIDHLLGRHQPLDPYFDDMRGDDRFRQLIMQMCAGTNDPNCVYGAQKSRP